LPFSRYTESQLRRLLPMLQADETVSQETLQAADIAARLEQLRRGLEPEDEFSLILTWLGRCCLVHKLGQEQLPIGSPAALRVPDLLAIFEHGGKLVPVIIEVKSTNRMSTAQLNPTLSLKPALLKYAKTLGLPLLVAWRCLGFWILFDAAHARKADTNLKIDFERAARENLLGLLAGDVLYRLAPGTAIRMRIERMSEADAEGSFEGVIRDVHFENPAGQRIPSIPHLSSLFLFWQNDVELVDEDDAIIQSFVVPEPEGMDTIASGSDTFSRILHASARLRRRRPNLQAVMHTLTHWVHEPEGFQLFLGAARKHGVVDKVMHVRPRTAPSFLKASKRAQRSG
jgi:hypothetical protein